MPTPTVGSPDFATGFRYCSFRNDRGTAARATDILVQPAILLHVRLSMPNLNFKKVSLELDRAVVWYQSIADLLDSSGISLQNCPIAHVLHAVPVRNMSGESDKHWRRVEQAAWEMAALVRGWGVRGGALLNGKFYFLFQQTQRLKLPQRTWHT